MSTSPALWTEEIFAPIAPVVVVKDADEAVALADHTGYGLVNSVVTGDLFRGGEIARQLRAGLVHVNDATPQDEASAPFGGSGQSGVGGRSGGDANLEEFTERRWLTLNPGQVHYPAPERAGAGHLARLPQRADRVDHELGLARPAAVDRHLARLGPGRHRVDHDAGRTGAPGTPAGSAGTPPPALAALTGGTAQRAPEPPARQLRSSSILAAAWRRWSGSGVLVAAIAAIANSAARPGSPVNSRTWATRNSAGPSPDPLAAASAAS